MLKYRLIILLNFFVLSLSAQNLVKDSSFEAVFECTPSPQWPTLASYHIQDTSLLFWTNPTEASPDLLCGCFDTCYYSSNFNSYKVPKNIAGFQIPRSFHNYIGVCTYFKDYNFMEYIQGNLMLTLLSQKKYKICFYISLADSSHIATNKLGIKFLPNEEFYNYSGSLNNLGIYPNLEDNQIITDTTNWVKVEFDYIASGGEKYFIIGNFNTNANTDTLIVRWPLNPTRSWSYYYIDDVSVVFNDTIYKANAGQDTNICKGKSTTLGTHNFSDYQYKWFPNTGLSNDTLANPIASPSITTTYILELKDFFDTLTYDTVVVQVIPCEPANAGADQSICPNQSIELGTHNYEGYTYTWSPINGLDNPNIANPTAAPVANITYTLTVLDLLQTLTTDEIQITIKDCDTTKKEIIIPNVFTPNNDGYNDYFVIENLQENTSLLIFNRWGNKVFESHDYNNTWDAQNVSAGVYYYVLKLANGDNKQGVIEVIK